MTAMTTTSLPAGAWTSLYTAAGAVTITLQNQSPASDLMIRIATGATTGDALTAAADVLRPFEHRSATLANGDVVMARPVQTDMPGKINIRA